MDSTLVARVEATLAYLRGVSGVVPEVAIVLGSGLGGLAARVEGAVRVPYAQIPHFPRSTVEGHAGELLFGRMAGRPVVVMSGRFHYYEGYSMEQVTYPVRVFSRMGVRLLLLSNASGGVNPTFCPGDIMLIEDHINLMPNPLIGPNEVTFGTRFPSMNDAYSARYRALARRVAHESGIPLTRGTYVGTTGPSFETPREYHYFRTIGADAVGMSTVPEVIVARHCGLEVLAFSVVANVGGLAHREAVTHEEVQANGAVAGERLTQLVERVVGQMEA